MKIEHVMYLCICIFMICGAWAALRMPEYYVPICKHNIDQDHKIGRLDALVDNIYKQLNVSKDEIEY